MSENPESSYFTTAIECLESGDLDKAEGLFKLTVEQMGPTHNQSHLAYKSLISIASEKGEYTKALNVSLDLLDAQVNTFGIRHAESSRTINNIYTLCNTLGKHELAKEIMQMAKDAEQKTVATSVKKLRGDKEELLEEEEEKIELPGAQTMIGKIAQPVNSLFGVMGKRLKCLVCMTIVLGLLGTIFGALFSLKYLDKGGLSDIENLAENQYISADGSIALQFDKTGKANFDIGQRRFILPTTYYKNPSNHIASLLLSPVTAKEFWIYKTPQGIDGLGDFTLYSLNNAEVELIRLMKNIMVVSNRWFDEQKQYPDSFHDVENAEMFEYKNPFTLRKDYPIVQEIKLPDSRFSNMNHLLGTLQAGGTWTKEASLYPGAVNCLHVQAETENSFIEKFVIHACDRYGQLIRDASGNTFLMQSTSGITEKTKIGSSAAIAAATKIGIIDQSLSSISSLLKYRLTIFYLTIGLIFLGVGKLIPDTVAKVTAGLICFVCLSISVVTAIIWYLPI